MKYFYENEIFLLMFAPPDSREEMRRRLMVMLNFLTEENQACSSPTLPVSQAARCRRPTDVTTDELGVNTEVNTGRANTGTAGQHGNISHGHQRRDTRERRGEKLTNQVRSEGRTMYIFTSDGLFRGISG